MQKGSRRWWKAYFVFLVLITVGSLAASVYGLVVDDDELGSLVEWLTYPYQVIQLVGIFGYAYHRRFATRRAWRMVFVASVVITVGTFVTSVLDGIPLEVDLSMILILLGFVVLAEGIACVALFHYAYRSDELWIEPPRSEIS